MTEPASTARDGLTHWTVRCADGEVHVICDDEDDANSQCYLMAGWLECGPHHVGRAVDAVR